MENHRQRQMKMASNLSQLIQIDGDGQIDIQIGIDWDRQKQIQIERDRFTQIKIDSEIKKDLDIQKQF